MFLKPSSPCRRILKSCATALLAAALATPAMASAETTVRTRAGRVSGVVDSAGVTSFKGIPYARAPIGDLRWRAPQPSEPWRGVRDGSHMGAICMQPDSPALASQPPMSEDCLTINVWRPENTTRARLPVLVWIHGGGWVSGSSAEPEYDGAALARRGVIVVSFNYRLGRFGFFAHPELSQADADRGLFGNYGYMDQLAALRWVRDNVGAFGGDPARVTLFGSSAGGASVEAMMMAPEARRLFSAVIISSSADPDMPHVAEKSAGGLPSGEAAGVGFARLVHAETLEQLRRLPAARVLEQAAFPNKRPDLFSGPMIDGRLVTEAPGAAFAAGNVARVPMLAGAQDGELLGVLQAANADAMSALLAGRLPAGSFDRLRPLYDPDGTARLARVRLDMLGDRLFVAHARETVRAMQRLGLPAWEYRFAHVAEAHRGEWAGAGHGSNGGYAFDRLNSMPADAGPFSVKDQQTAQAYADAIVNFVKRHDPNGPTTPSWPQQQPGDQLMWFGNDGPELKVDPWRVRLDAMGSVTGVRVN